MAGGQGKPPESNVRSPEETEPVSRRCEHVLCLLLGTNAAALAAKPPFSHPEWLFELKLDGRRTLCFVREGKTHLISRRRNSLNERFPEFRDIAEPIKAKIAVIDGEIVAPNEDGLAQFDAL